MRYRFTNEAVKKWQDKPLRVTIVGIALLVITIVLIAVGYIKAAGRRDNPINLFDEKISDLFAPEYYVLYTDISEEPVQFAYEGDEGYYFIWDGSRYGVAMMDSSEYDQITAGVNEQGTYHIMGCYKYIPDDIAQFGIETMNEAIDDAPVDSSNYADYFGKYCIDVELGKMDLFNLNMEMTIAILTGIFMLACLAEGLWNMNCVTKHLAKDGIDMERLDREMNSSDSTLFEEIGTYLTENYIVYFKEEIRAFRYTDIVWAFMNQTEGGDAQGLSAAGRAGGMVGGAVGGLIGGLIGGAIGAAMGTSNPYGITIYLRNGMAWNISMGKSKQTTVDEITRALSIMKEKNPDIRIGYTPENEMEVKKILQNRR